MDAFQFTFLKSEWRTREFLIKCFFRRIHQSHISFKMETVFHIWVTWQWNGIVFELYNVPFTFVIVFCHLLFFNSCFNFVQNCTGKPTTGHMERFQPSKPTHSFRKQSNGSSRLLWLVKGPLFPKTNVRKHVKKYEHFLIERFNMKDFKGIY